jgi:hypothetical protein
VVSNCYSVFNLIHSWSPGGKRKDVEICTILNNRKHEVSRSSPSPKAGLTASLANAVSVRGLTFDGPYGQNLHVENYYNVLLVAKGIGISGVLAYAKRLVTWTAHSLHKRLVITRKLEVYWELDDNSEEEWVGPFLRKLQDISVSNSPLTTITLTYMKGVR